MTQTHRKSSPWSIGVIVAALGLTLTGLGYVVRAGELKDQIAVAVATSAANAAELAHQKTDIATIAVDVSYIRGRLDGFLKEVHNEGKVSVGIPHRP